MEKYFKNSYKNNKSKISGNDKFELSDGSFSVSHIQEYPVRIYVNKIEKESYLKLK